MSWVQGPVRRRPRFFEAHGRYAEWAEDLFYVGILLGLAGVFVWADCVLAAPYAVGGGYFLGEAVGYYRRR